MGGRSPDASNSTRPQIVAPCCTAASTSATFASLTMTGALAQNVGATGAGAIAFPRSLVGNPNVWPSVTSSCVSESIPAAWAACGTAMAVTVYEPGGTFSNANVPSEVTYVD